MAEHLTVAQGDKITQYEILVPQIAALLKDEPNWIARMANVSAALKTTFDWFWIGFYCVDTSNKTLVLGPFQGSIACTRIPYGRGVCGAAWQSKKVQIVPNVHEFTDHIACSSATLSEIVLPIFNASNEVIGVLDADADELAQFDETDRLYLEKIIQLLCEDVSF
ncbi:MAG: GAF domain-containing protein [Neisseriaceae bacterium]|nr:GAF domain-containing protein [Neisseriaceae bacterium]